MTDARGDRRDRPRCERARQSPGPLGQPSRGRRQQDAEALVVRLCRRFHLFARQLLERRERRATVQVSDEYDVQDLMHALLRLHFEDVRAEEVTPSVAGKAGRMDFLLKPERLVVETKMTRRSLGQRELGDELIVDMKRYRAHPDQRTLVCLVYDPGGYCHAPAALESDLSGEDAGFRSVVVVCPKGL
jgi:REase_DpnII-MboI